MVHGRRVLPALVFIAFTLAPVAVADVWDEAYKRGTNAIKRQNYGEAVAELQRAIEDAPSEFISEGQAKNGLTAYLPHYWLGIAKFNVGDVDGALGEWRISQEQGVVLKNAYYAERLRDWMARANTEKQRKSDLAEGKRIASEALNRAVSAQKDALAASADRSRTYRAALGGLQQAQAAYSKEPADSESYQRAFGLASEASSLFAAATAEAKKQTARSIPEPQTPQPQRKPESQPTPAPRAPQRRPAQTLVAPPPPVTTTSAMPSSITLTSASPPITLTSASPPITLTSASPPITLTSAPPPATTTSAPPTSFPADELLKRQANIAFNTPEQINLDDHRVIKLLLDFQRPAKELQQQLHEPGRTATAAIKISDAVEARLTGAAFDIRPITPELQAVSAEETTEWKWEVTPKQEGKHILFLTVNAILGSGAEQRRRSIRTFDRTIEVLVPPPFRGGWIVPISVVAGIVVVLLLLLWFALRRRPPPAVDDTLRDALPAAKTTIPAPTVVSSASSMRFREGQVVGERYRIIRLLGEGGMGAVYAAEDREFEGEVVALKTILAPGEDPDRVLARFKKEIQLARRVAHPNVSRIFDVGYHVTGTGEKTIFVSMEYMTGVTLKSVIQQKGRLTEREALAIIRDVAAALDATHAAGLIHRDVKSGNVMLADNGRRAVLMDFGVACLSDPAAGGLSLTRTGVIIGTPSYMSPEQIEGGPLTAATDIYAFGMVIYEMVTGRLPYEGDTPMSILAKRFRERPRSPFDFVPNLKKEWEQAILRCLENDPSKRFRSATDVSRALERAADAPTLAM